jgi:hypothetical protein
MFCRSKNDTHKVKKTNRVKNLTANVCWADVSPGWKKNCAKKTQQYTNIWATNMLKIECCVSYDQLPIERTKQKFVDF